MGRFITEAGAATATFLLSATVFATSGFFALRGSEITVLPPDRALLYRSGDGDQALLTLALPAKMINTASPDHGDVLLKAVAQITPDGGGGALRFPLDALVGPVFILDRDAPPAPCEYRVRCVHFPGALMVERADQLISLPGGAARNDYLAFRLVSNVCEGGDGCARFQHFDQAVQVLRAGPALAFSAGLDFKSDGSVRAECNVAQDKHGGKAAILTYLEEKGWVSLICEQRSSD